MRPSGDYVLVTAARNEAASIGGTIEAVLRQTAPPRQWVIVSDGSDDGTDGVVAGYAHETAWIDFVRRQGGGERGVASKVAAVRLGAERIAAPHDFWGNLDADVTFGPTYFETLLARFAENPALGLAGGLVHELVGGRFRAQRMSEGSVAGAVQLFRRECREQVGGYRPIAFGGEDAAAEITARSLGWQVATFRDLVVNHHRPVGRGTGRVLRARIRQGRMDYVLGYHPLFELVRCCARLVEPPWLIGGLLRLAGYGWSAVRRDARALPPGTVAFLRAEQVGRIRGRRRPFPAAREVEHVRDLRRV